MHVGETYDRGDGGDVIVSASDDCPCAESLEVGGGVREHLVLKYAKSSVDQHRGP